MNLKTAEETLMDRIETEYGLPIAEHVTISSDLEAGAVTARLDIEPSELTEDDRERWVENLRISGYDEAAESLEGAGLST